MKTNLIDTGKWTRELEVEVPATRIEGEFDKACRRYQKRLEIPGFRKGKVPLKIVVRRYGEAIRNSLINELLPTLLGEAARETGLVPAAPAKISKVDHEPGRALTFTARMDIWPEIEVEYCENLKLTRLVHEVGEEEIELQIKELQQRQATERSVERPLEKGDVLIADLQRLDQSDLPIVGQRFEERYFIIGSEDSPSPEFDERLMGIRTGEERRVRFRYREDLDNEQLAGEEDYFSVVAREVRQRTLPAINDEFARDLGEHFHNMEELRLHLAAQIEEQWDYIARQKTRGDLIEALIEKNPFELPESIVEHYLDSLRRRRGPEHEGEPGEENRSAAVRQIKRFLLLEGVKKKAGIQVSDEEFEVYLRRRAEESGLELEDLKRSPRLDELRRELEEDRVFDFLSAAAEVEEKRV